ncbi:MAG: efflux RND transporter permease subunit [Myxococcales bacterium]|nr:efflux RND transporter permease subunit [Myxococcales bacterium]
MWSLHFTLNTMTLLALSLAIGLLIDDAVVVRENISKRLERGGARRAAQEGTARSRSACSRPRFTIVAVFVPVALHERHLGQFFSPVRAHRHRGGAGVALRGVHARPHALEPLLPKAHAAGAKDPFMPPTRPFLAVFEGIEGVYRRVLGFALRNKIVVGLGAFLALFSIGPVAGLMGNEFVNQEDRGQFVLEAELPAGTKLDETARPSLPAGFQGARGPKVHHRASTLRRRAR